MHGLGPKYESFTTAMLKPPMPLFNDLIPMLHNHELRNKKHFSEELVHNMAFLGEQQHGGGPRLNGGRNKNLNTRGNKHNGQYLRTFPQKGKVLSKLVHKLDQESPMSQLNHPKGKVRHKKIILEERNKPCANIQFNMIYGLEIC